MLCCEHPVRTQPLVPLFSEREITSHPLCTCSWIFKSAPFRDPCVHRRSLPARSRIPRIFHGHLKRPITPPGQMYRRGPGRAEPDCCRTNANSSGCSRNVSEPSLHGLGFRRDRGSPWPWAFRAVGSWRESKNCCD